jgi:hypothetical protein
MMMFQDELVNLLDQFHIEALNSFDRLPPEEKHYFLTRLYKCFEKGLRDLGKELQGLRGLKLHYTRELGTANANVKLEDIFYKKLSFYASRTVVTCPIEEVSSDTKAAKSKRLGSRTRLDSGALLKLRTEGSYVFGDVKANKRTHGGEIHVEGRAYIVSKSELTALLETILNLRQAIKHGLIHILPALPDRERELKAALRKGRVARGNFTRDGLVRQFTERDLSASEHYVDVGLTSIYLPHVTNVPLEAILDLREQEAEIYAEFQSAIEEFVYVSDDKISEKKIEEYLRRVDDGVRAIRAKYLLLEKNWTLRKYEMGIEFLALCFVPFLSPDLAKALTPFIGTITAFDFLRSSREYREQRNAVASDKFYIAWKLSEFEDMYPH